ncbi:ExbD/TolR family protein [Hydrogenimonas urashimensis]|uniref:ExbD/TolR family protein n=1 Tax=Hydrogenimonas urashimensis TaxID=2740515 RepID=UPI001916A7D6|nr:biopolymer transporter ExbD [Hydrogenimonas urashimensis]
MRRRESLTLDMTPLVDVVFLLLIFFLVTSVFKKDELALLLNLPEGKEGGQMVKRKEVIIEMGEDTLAYNGRPIDFKTLDKELGAIVEKRLPVIIRIDEKVEYGRIIKLFDMLKKHRLSNIALVEKAKK